MKNSFVEILPSLLEAKRRTLRRINILFFSRIIRIYYRSQGVIQGKGIKYNGFPLIRRYPKSTIKIGSNCILNSSKNSVSIQLQRRCTFVTMSKDAVISIGKNSGVSGLIIGSKEKVEIGANVLIGAECTIFDTDFHNSNPEQRQTLDKSARPVIIKNNVFIGLGCTILKGVTIGENSVIGAKSLVINNIPPNSIAIGNPCKVLLQRK